jgi:hypothetical protein
MPYGMGENISNSPVCSWSGVEAPCLCLRILNLKENKFNNIQRTAVPETHHTLQKYLSQGIIVDKLCNFLS